MRHRHIQSFTNKPRLWATKKQIVWIGRLKVLLYGDYCSVTMYHMYNGRTYRTLLQPHSPNWVKAKKAAIIKLRQQAYLAEQRLFRKLTQRTPE